MSAQNAAVGSRRFIPLSTNQFMGHKVNQGMAEIPPDERIPKLVFSSQRTNRVFRPVRRSENPV